jgi:hypothetical protein
VYYLINEVLPDESGFLTGNNSLGHTAFADSFYTGEDKIINGIRFDFAIAHAMNFSTQITAAVWGANSIGNGPGDIVGQATFSLASVELNVENFTYTDVYFAEPPTVSGAYYAGFILTTSTGDTIAIYSNQFDEINSNTAWYWNASGEWKAFSDTSLYGQALSLAIKPVQCIPLSVHQAIAHAQNGQLHIYPNPVSQADVTIQHALKSGVWQLFSMDGKLVNHGSISFGNALQLDVSGLLDGMYFIKMDDGRQVQTGKFFKNGNN